MRTQTIVVLYVMLMSITIATSCDKLVLKTCAGWALGRYPEVKIFINEDSKHFSSGFTVDLSAGGNPRLVCYKGDQETVTEVHMLNRTQLRAKVIEMGYSALDTLTNLVTEEASEL